MSTSSNVFFWAANSLHDTCSNTAHLCFPRTRIFDVSSELGFVFEALSAIRAEAYVFHLIWICGTHELMTVQIRLSEVQFRAVIAFLGWIRVV